MSYCGLHNVILWTTQCHTVDYTMSYCGLYNVILWTIQTLYFYRYRNETSQTHIMAVLWKGTCRDLRRLCKFRCVTANSNVRKTTVQEIRSNSTHFNKWHLALLHVSTRKVSSL